MNAWEIVFQTLLVFAPHVGYVAQYFEIVKSNSIEGYAPMVSLILLTSNTLRLYYYIGKHYMLALLFQAILGVLVHFWVLIKVLDVHVSQMVSARQDEVLFDENATSPSPLVVPISVEEAGSKPAPAVTDAQGSFSSATHVQGDTVLAEDVHAASPPVAAAFFRFVRFLFHLEDTIERSLLRLTPRSFAFSYVASACVTLVAVLFYYFSIGRVWASAPAVVGYISLGIEALLVLPQILRNARRRSTEGLSMILILTWVVGDVIKVVYYCYAKQALPFIIGGIFQILLDVVVVAQVVYYGFYLRRGSVAGSGEEAADPAP
ncbi:hypothetical protein ABB37_09434 [Leptomonas pyrrhocoris]|uniref:Uncharacterized protein n=1 Tax=Leptomonas pyrrhocoris TaxID=157538 RepID=A0A0M9FQX3_LEPPY|nr:hypothetical protein ABB37_09434 [Leptomonas pyrrhocoris]XP_015652611.1 hypothetical protein ABB37_09434 [Leptomonas pyrrhocoris]XP_015652612.1 hypothetical protein ABB37_09434 [Leptomonas pyrrhocoris]KPA74171.1 hypothetical protein ABB37_09434 [Leptomonas pyrrhocoris]KPA74172.1 hypothetical protein ABB37_09434 [Leptomonas pyrrhocoris]KPA74173.1 hypothetical protein ABB37_09434 [Leptomonas pyrrhocoris]|eukprot:XP_015652610.1 hypothetical protein ABB37_09434 [Leptomonas pyrrhocoris]